MIVFSLKRGFNKGIIGIYIDYFGAETVKNALEKDRDSMSDSFYSKIIVTLRDYNDPS